MGGGQIQVAERAPRSMVSPAPNGLSHWFRYPHPPIFSKIQTTEVISQNKTSKTRPRYYEIFPHNDKLIINETGKKNQTFLKSLGTLTEQFAKDHPKCG